jgi:tripartite ATP-independent transporter DctM subunit
MSTDPIAVFLLITTFVVLILLGLDIVFCVGISSVITIFYIGVPIQIIVQRIVGGVNVFALMAVPLFILMGEIMKEGGISRRLIKLADSSVGWIRGGLGLVNILASMFFGGISGSPTADASSIGSIMIPMMKEAGYDEDFAATVTISSSIQGLLIPPSHNIVIYALVAGGVSIGKLFLAGAVPGIFLGIALMIYCYFISIKKNYPVNSKFVLKDLITNFWQAALGLATVFIVVYGVISGVFTVTESAAIAVFYSFLITVFVYKELDFTKIKKIFFNCIRTLSIIMLLIGVSSGFAWVMSYLRVPTLVTEFLLGISENNIIQLLIVNLILIVLGGFMDMIAIIVIITPILLPVVTSLGMSPIHFGVIIMLNLGIGLLTPPFGIVLYIGSAIANIKIETLSKSMLPFYIVLLLVLLCITFIPEIVMFLPGILM